MSLLKRILGKPNVEKLLKKKDVPGLVEALTFDDPQVRLAVVRAADTLHDERFVAPLGRVLADRQNSTTLRQETARVLGDYPQLPAVQALIDALKWSSHGYVIEAITDSLTRIGAPAIPLLIRNIDRHARVALGNIGEPAVLPLLEALERERDPHVIVALGTIGDRRTVAPLLQVLEELAEPTTTDGRYHWQALHNDTGLDQGPNLPEPYARLLQLYRTTVAALGQIGDERAVGPLLALVESRMDRRVRCSAISALAQINASQSHSVLLAILENEDEYPEVRKAAAAALEDMDVPRDPAATAQEAVLKKDWRMAVQQGQAARDLLLQAIASREKNDYAKTWTDLAEALEESEDTWVIVPALALAYQLYFSRHLRSPGSDVDKTGTHPALEALNRHAETYDVARAILLEGQFRDVSDVRRGAIRWLGDYRGPDSLDVFVSLLRDEYERETHGLVIAALEAYGDESVREPVADFILRQPSRSASGAAARTLKRIGIPENAPDPVKVRVAIFTEDWPAAVALGSAAVEDLIHEVEGGWAEAALALGQIGDPRAVEPICRRLEAVVQTVIGRYRAADSWRLGGDAAYVPRMDDVREEGEKLIAALAELGDRRALPCLESTASNDLVQGHLPGLEKAARDAQAQIKKRVG